MLFASVSFLLSQVEIASTIGSYSETIFFGKIFLIGALLDHFLQVLVFIRTRPTNLPRYIKYQNLLTTIIDFALVFPL